MSIDIILNLTFLLFGVFTGLTVGDILRDLNEREERGDK